VFRYFSRQPFLNATSAAPLLLTDTNELSI